jgi:hypothetical protein
MEARMLISGVDFFQSPRGSRAKAARTWFAEHGPSDMQPLPLGYNEREALKDGSPKHILAWYARSLADLKYDSLKHPSFYDYACGVMALPQSSFSSLDSVSELLKRFPPRLLEGLNSHLYWKPPKSRARVRVGGRGCMIGIKETAPITEGGAHGVIP